jgi:hypothetical protein
LRRCNSRPGVEKGLALMLAGFATPLPMNASSLLLEEWRVGGLKCLPLPHLYLCFMPCVSMGDAARLHVCMRWTNYYLRMELLAQVQHAF